MDGYEILNIQIVGQKRDFCFGVRGFRKRKLSLQSVDDDGWLIYDLEILMSSVSNRFEFNSE